MSEKNRQKPIAITGYSYRLPGGLYTDEDFWSVLKERKIVQERISDRFGRGYQPIDNMDCFSRFASPYEGLIRNNEESLFDPNLFGISKNECLYIDPQAKMMLNCTWEAFEHAGLNFKNLKNSATGVFIGSETPAIANWRSPLGNNEYSPLAVSLAILANRVSYQFNLMGSSMTYCTACSAGLSALHSALLALNAGDCEMALVGAVHYLGATRYSSGTKQLGVISPDGKCYSFDAKANGYMRAEGCFAFVLKPLESAQHDGDRIFAVIEASAVNSAGAADDATGLTQGRYITAPTRHAQVDLIRTALGRANRDPQEIDYLEAHATGTVVGDRIEGNAISEAFSNSKRNESLRISSVKSNIGHLEPAAFNASLLKVILMMQRRTFAPISQNFLEPNPEIDFESCPMHVLTRCEPFPNRQTVVGINSFGFGGANGHCVVSEYRPKQKRVWSIPLAPESGYMIPISARNSEALIQSVQNLGEFLDKNPVDLYTLAGNLSRRRTHFGMRTSLCALNVSQLQEKIHNFGDTKKAIASIASTSETRKIAMIFSGQGTQWVGCGKSLYFVNPVIRKAVDRIDKFWLEHSDVSLREVCFDSTQDQLNEARYAQPVIFMIQCALVELFKTWGVYADVVVGHSSGEVAAAYASGVLTLGEATEVIFHRARLQQRTAGSGRMLACGIDQASLEQVLDDLRMSHHSGNGTCRSIEFACFNSPASVVVCGQEETLEQLIEELDRRQIQNRLLPGNIAFHSSAMNPIKDDVLTELSFLDRLNFDSKVPFISSVTGARMHQLDSAYWWSNIREPVKFADAIHTIDKEFSADVYLEISPHRALQSMVMQCLTDNHSTATSISTLLRDSDERTCFNEALGHLYQVGVDLDFESQYPLPEPIPHRLPGHPKDLRLLLDVNVDDELFVNRGAFSHGPLVGKKLSSHSLKFEVNLSKREMPFLADHRVHFSAILPASGYVELVLEAFEGVPVFIEEISFLQACPIPDFPVCLQTELILENEPAQEYSFSISTIPIQGDATSELHSRGRLRLIDGAHQINVPRHLSEIDLSGFEPAFENSDVNFYDRLEVTLGNKFQYGEYFRTLQDIQRNIATRSFLIELNLDEDLWFAGVEEGYVLYPPLVDGALQVFLYNLMQATDIFVIPGRIKNITFLKPPTTPKVTVHVGIPLQGAFQLDDMALKSVKHGESPSGSLCFYDSVTGELFLHFEEYVCYHSNPIWANASNCRHVMRWQPKFMRRADRNFTDQLANEIDAADLIKQLIHSPDGKPCVPHIVEFADRVEPKQTVLQSCVKRLADSRAQIEYWLVNDSAESTQSSYEHFFHQNITLRFETLDRKLPSNTKLRSGLLRNNAASLLIVHLGVAENDFSDHEWKLFHRLMIAGGYALICHDEFRTIRVPEGWQEIRAENKRTLLQAPQTLTEESSDLDSPKLRLVVGDINGVATKWIAAFANGKNPNCFTSNFDEAIVQLDTFWQDSKASYAIDVFIETNPDDPTGEMTCASFVEFIQAAISYRIESNFGKTRINVITQKAVMDVDVPQSYTLWGLVRSLVIETGADSDFEFRLIDIGGSEDLKTLKWLDSNDVREREVAIRKGQIWVPRVNEHRDQIPVVSNDEENTNYKLHIEHPGQISGLQFKSFQARQLGEHDVEIRVEFVGLNFRDVMVALGLLPQLAYEQSKFGQVVGMEASGIIERVGTKVRQHKVGDQVIIFEPGCVANRVVCDEFLVFAKPENLAMSEAASAVSVSVTAYYSLIHIARLKRGQSVLIHSAMGGVGQTAIGIAKYVGAEIFATAGTEAKRQQLIDLGVAAAFDSHSFDWYDELMEATGGRGVDVVLNSLAGRHISLCLNALKPGGWHCEIGKVDIFADNSLRLCVFRKNLRFAAIDIDRLMLDDPELVKQMTESVLKLFQQGCVHPIPTTIYEYKDYEKALRFMMSGQHQGKLVLKSPAVRSEIDELCVVDRRPYLKSDASYLLTGGFGGFGLTLLPYLVISGARHLTLLDRDPERRRTVEWIFQNSTLGDLGIDVQIDIVAADVTCEEDVERCVNDLTHPLKGVFHLAGVLDDHLLTDLNAESFAKVFAPKAKGALNLHHATKKCDLDYFVMFSSIASTFGNFGQVNYSAANAFLDGLAVYRRQIGLPALAFNMAGITESGMAARDLHVLRLMRASGMPPVSKSVTMQNLDYVLRKMSQFDHAIITKFENPPWTVDSGEYMRSGRCISNQNAYQTGTNIQQTVESLTAQIASKVAELCGHDEVNIEESLSSFGLTSLSVSELGAYIQTQFNFQVNALDLMTTSSCLSLAEAILRHNVSTEQMADEVQTGASEIESNESFQPCIQHTPSEFAFTLEDHFPVSNQDRPS